jgi:iron complex outermembrane receptor protein
MRMRVLLLALFSFLFSAEALYAQVKKTVTGVVRTTEGTALAGATVNEKGTKNTVVSDENGAFSINVASNATLAVSYAGYAAQDVSTAGSGPLSISLQTASGTMSEVVVTGFGETRNRRNLGYSLTQVSGDDIRRTGNPNPISALRGMVPGLQITPNAGGPQASTRFLIRGSANLDPYGNQPLVVVDDIVMDEQVILPNRGGEQDFGNILKNINPDDIESISVLKGGAVTALYGSRASNGVILIRTKKGFSQRGLGISVNQSFMFEKAYRTVDLQNRFGAGILPNDWTKDAQGNLSPNTAYYYFSFGPEMNGQQFTDITGQVRANTPGANDPLAFYETGVTRNTNVAISGGNEKSTFRFSYSNLGAKSATPNNKLDRNSFNLRATHRPIRQVLMDVNATYNNSDVDNPALQGSNAVLYAAAYGVPRNYDFKYWLNNYVDPAVGGLSDLDISGASRAFWSVYQNKYNRKEDNIRGNFNLRADITNWLRFEGSASYNQIGTYYTAKVRGQDAGFVGGDYTVDELTTQQQRYYGSMNYLNKFGDFDILIKGGAELNKTRSHGIFLSTNGLIVPDVFRLSNNSGQNIETRESRPNATQNNSLFFQGSFGYKNYLTLNVYGRNDWNSTLVYNDGHGNYSYFYPGADVAFVFTDLFKLPKFADFGKLRLSYAKVGGGTSPYNTSTGSYSNFGQYVDPNGNTVLRYGIAGGTLQNRNLFPVSNTKLEAGIEFKLLRNRLGGDFTVYQQDSKNQIQGFDVPLESGVRKALVNAGEVRNKGIEVTLYGTPVKTNNFSWDVLANYTRNRNTIRSLNFGAQYAILDEGDGIYSAAQVGGDYGVIRSPYSFAYYQAKNGSGANVESPLNGLPVVAFSATGGSLGDPVIYYQRALNYNNTVGNDVQPVVGSTLPKFLGSVRNTFNYKRLSLSVFLDAKFGGDVYSTTYGYGSQYGMIKHTLFGRNAELGGLTYQSKANFNGQPIGTRDDGILPVGVFAPGTVIPASASADGQSHDVSNMSVADAYAKGFIKPTPARDYYDRTYGWASGLRSMSVFESSWVSLRELSVSYELPQQVAEKIRMNNLRLSLVGTNLLFLYNSAPDHVNPDNLSSTSAGAFMENGGTPYFRQFGFTINANF